jgi:Ni/Co efflux regulator RcnB
MKLSFLTTVFALALAVAPQAAAQTTGTSQKTETRTRTETRTQREIEREAEREAEREEREHDRQEREREESRHDTHEQSAAIERTSAAEAQAVVTLCLSRGDVIVRGWDKTEVHAQAEGAGNVRLLTPVNVQPAPRVEVLIADDEETEPDPGDCGSADQVELMVPRGATVNVRTQNGHVDVSDVSDARIETLSGDVDVRRVARAVLVSCLNGDVMLSDVSGPVRANTVSGSVEARNARALAAGDGFEAKSTSGDVTIENVKHTQVTAAAVSGNVLYTGALARGGAYDFRTISGDVTMEIPSDSSFKLHAKVVVSGDIDTDFPVKTAAVGSLGPAADSMGGPPSTSGAPLPGASPMPPPPQGGRVKPGKMKPPKEPEQVRLDGTVGSGDATVNMSSFSGSLHLRKQ